MEKELKRKIVIYDIISNLISSILALIIVTIIIYFFKDFFSNYKELVKLGYIILGIDILYEICIEPFLMIKIFKYNITDKSIEYNKGAIFTKKTIIPMRRVQQIETETDPLLKRMGLAKINIITTTGNHQLRRISLGESKEIIKFITEKVNIELNGDNNDKK